MDSPGKNTGVGCHAPPGNLPNPGIEPTSLMSSALTGGFFTTSATWEAQWSDTEGKKSVLNGENNTNRSMVKESSEHRDSLEFSFLMA